MESEESRPELGHSEKYFRYFQQETTALQQQMTELEHTALMGVGAAGAGERADAVGQCLARITRLTRSVQDASSSLPRYDQRRYAEETKALSDRFQEIRSSIAPRPKFSFKSAHKVNPGVGPQQKEPIKTPISGPGASSISNKSTTELSVPTPSVESMTVCGHGDQRVFEPYFSEPTKGITIANHSNIHIILPSSAASRATSFSGSLTNFRGCVIDMLEPTSSSATDNKPYSSLTLKNIHGSLILCGTVDGPAHITGVKNSTIVVRCRQFRLHECEHVVVYLFCSSRPIIERCANVRFTPMGDVGAVHDHPQAPSSHDEDEDETPNQWNQVDDFNWIKSKSPNWSVLPVEDRIPGSVWKRIISPGRGKEDAETEWLALEDILRLTVPQ